MYVLIAGAGTVGQALAIKLASSTSISETRHNVTVIEQDRRICDALYARHGITTHVGDATDIDLLRDAGIEKVDVAVATMHHDAANLAFTLLAKHFKVPRIIVRMRNTEYEKAYREAGATQALNLVDMLLVQLTLEIEEPNVRTVATFGEGKASVFVLNIPKDWDGSGATIEEIAASREFPNDVVITGVYNVEKKEFVIPRGPTSVMAGDQMFIACDSRDAVRDASAFFRIPMPRKLE